MKISKNAHLLLKLPIFFTKNPDGEDARMIFDLHELMSCPHKFGNKFGI